VWCVVGTLKTVRLAVSCVHGGSRVPVRCPAGVLPHTTSESLWGVVSGRGAGREATAGMVADDELWAVDRCRSSDALNSLEGVAIVAVDASRCALDFLSSDVAERESCCLLSCCHAVMLSAREPRTRQNRQNRCTRASAGTFFAPSCVSKYNIDRHRISLTPIPILRSPQSTIIHDKNSWVRINIGIFMLTRL
jgi:hypothetical protein